MRFNELHVANFKAIDQLSLVDLRDVIVIAGPNGSGKSTIFDAIRFWKSAIGPYQRDEVRQWYSELGVGEAQLSPNSLHQHKDEPLSVRASVELSSEECDKLLSNAHNILSFYFYKLRVNSNPITPNLTSLHNLDMFDDFRYHKDAILQQTNDAMPELERLRHDRILTGSITVNVDGELTVDAPLALRLVLSVFSPEDVGIIDYYGPERAFGREYVQNVNLILETSKRSQQQNTALYNYSQKYSNVKSELASDYIRRVISGAAEGSVPNDAGLDHSISELFQTFIPGKRFEGIKPTLDGRLTFNVRTLAGDHDINDLSSGEKELIYGYLRLKNANRRNSVILIDEPELHLNPRLTDGLPDFYFRHIGKPLNNQLWLVTHSDTILRQSVGYDGFTVFHMQTVGTYPTDQPQTVEVTDENDVNRAIIDLVGDLAAYKPNGKLVVLEGGGDSEIDKRIIETLFPDFTQKVNLISSENKTRVRNLHNVLESVGAANGMFSTVYSIVDRDGDDKDIALQQNRFRWDRYHVENYLLEPAIIRIVLLDQAEISSNVTAEEIYEMLRDAARTTKRMLVQHEVENHTYRTIRSSIKVSTSRDVEFDPLAVARRAEATAQHIQDIVRGPLSPDNLTTFSEEHSQRLEEALGTDDWVKLFRGRDILRAFTNQAFRKSKMRYEIVRNLIIARMRDSQFKPEGMNEIVIKILSENNEG